MFTYFEESELMAKADRFSSDYQTALPFPHILFENFIAEDHLSNILQHYPSAQQSLNWRKIHAKLDDTDVQYNKLGLPHEREIHPLIRQLLWEMNSSSFLKFLEKLTGIKGLIADPLLQGGGLHQTLPGGILGVHADFTQHRVYKLDRRINVLLYLNEDWQADYGGHIELWERDMSRCARRIKPTLGRCLVFNTDADSFHGHPDPVNCPAGQSRKSIALYYYTNGRDDKPVSATNATDWQKLPDHIKPDLE
ncbi:2OG-Fe(II) oxygenase [Halioxenophilus sp. WMMB6]|uniref:2OG-Fe(II) oxygenase n=1 Tax=Halioxenophilus sp. WMMB6 TaxID=3073815 RepID=UPI00295E4A78|nr:2OG-Fe(II) oxygenase [Halioxenophilus sp. WMMB6]